MKAQDYKVLSVESLPLDMSAREEIRTDENDRQCALFRIATQDISSAMKEGFYFGSDYGAYVVERFIVDGEIWVWVSPGLKTLKIKHVKLGQYEVHMPNYGIKVESLHTYKIVIQGSGEALGPETPTQQFLVFNVTPPDASLTVNGERWPLEDGFAQNKVNFGRYVYHIEFTGYHSIMDSVEVDNPEKMVFVKKELKKEEVIKKKERPFVKTLNFMTVNYAYSVAPQSSFGFTYGQVARFGWFISLMTNGSFKGQNSAAGICHNEDGVVWDETEYGSQPYYNGESMKARNSVVIGGVARLAKPLYVKLGAGYGFRNLFWLTEDGDYYYNKDYSYRGLEISGGLQFHLGSVVVSMEASALPEWGVEGYGYYLEGKFGLGYAF
ncbi:MAG: hypothetical protein J6P73_00895 [Bacteroidales bacterium]|nr:hypothetical protein [Bacteroidales bacterium]